MQAITAHRGSPFGVLGSALLALTMSASCGGSSGGSSRPDDPPSFHPTGPLTAPRHNFTATALGDGRVLVAGGCDWNGCVRSAELYDPATGTFATTVAVGCRCYHAAARLEGGKVLVVGGFGLGAQTAELFAEDSATFVATGSLNHARPMIPTITPLKDGDAIVLGGTDPNFVEVRTVERFSAASGTFAPAGELAVARRYHTATLLTNGKVLIAGGRTNRDAIIAAAELYDPATGGAVATGSFVVERTAHTATLLGDGRVLIAGGARPGAPSAELYDPATGTFTATGSMLDARAEHVAVLLPSGRVLVVGGVGTAAGGTGILATSEIYDPATGTFSSGPSMGDPRTSFAASPLPDAGVLVAGGYPDWSGSILASAEVYR